jgi:hypothetical protein
LKPGAEVQDAHGLEVDHNHNIYLAYTNWNNGLVHNGTDQHCLIRWNPDGSNGSFVGPGGPELCRGKPHGLKFATEDGVHYLYHANVQTETSNAGQTGKLTKTTLDGDVVWQVNGTFGQPDLASSYRPTWWAVPPTGPLDPSVGSIRAWISICLTHRRAPPPTPTGPFVYLADGYGSSHVYEFTRDGNFTNRTFGGKVRVGINVHVYRVTP